MIDSTIHIDPKPKIGPKKLIGNCFQPSILQVLRAVWLSDAGQDIVEHAVMLAIILILVIGSVLLMAGNANSALSSGSSNPQ